MKNRLNQKAMDLVKKGDCSFMIDTFEALFGMANETRADNASFRMIWNDKNISDDEFVPVLTLNVMRHSELKKLQNKKQSKSRVLRRLSFNLPVSKKKNCPNVFREKK